MRLQGRVKWFDAQKGYGFIERDGEDDIFVHFSVIKMEGYKVLEDGELVEFEINQTARGPQAAEVDRIGRATAEPPAQETGSEPLW